MQISKMKLSDYLANALMEGEGDTQEQPKQNQAPAPEGKSEGQPEGNDEDKGGEEPTMENVKEYFKEHKDKIDKFIEMCVNSDKAKELNLTAKTFKTVITMTPDEIKKYLEKMGVAAKEYVEENFPEDDLDNYKENEDACKKLAEEFHKKMEKIDADIFFTTITAYVEEKAKEKEEESKKSEEDDKKAEEKVKEKLGDKKLEDLSDDDKNAMLNDLTANDELPEASVKKALGISESFHDSLVKDLLKEIYE